MSTTEKKSFRGIKDKVFMLLSNASLGKHKEPQSYKRYDLKTSTSDEVRQGCLHFFPISQSLSPKSACLTDREHPQATSCKPIYHGKPVICKASVLIQQNQHGDYKQNDMASFAEALYKGAEKVETESSFFVSVDFFHSEQLVREHMHGSFDWTCDMQKFVFFLETKPKSFNLRKVEDLDLVFFTAKGMSFSELRPSQQPF